jgi:hypothetical protein
MAGLTSLTGGGGLSAGGGGPSSAGSDSTSGFRSDFNVTFGGGTATRLAPWIAIAAVAVAWMYFRRR